MEKHQTRKIRFRELHQVNGWTVKIYTIVKSGVFEEGLFYKNALEELPKWLELKNNFDDSNDKIAFLILHVGTEGIFSIINWWVGNNMLNTHIFISDKNQPNHFKQISGKGLAPCIWELEVINFERVSWMYHILKQAPKPNYQTYLEDHYNGEI